MTLFSQASSVLKRHWTSKFSAVLLSALVLGQACQPVKTAPEAQTQDLQQNLEKVAELAATIKCVVPSPQWYKDLWLDINAKENDLGRSLMTHYMGCSGKTYKLSEAEFRSLPISIVESSFGLMFLKRDFIQSAIANRTGRIGDKIADIDETFIATTHYGNTLGYFQMELRGKLVWRKNALDQIVPRFEGQTRVTDRYDFNPSGSHMKDSWRGRDTELRVRVAHVGLPGRDFEVESEWMNFSFDYPKYESDLIQEGPNAEKSGYSDYGQQVQLILMTELRSSRLEKATALERLGIIVQTMKRIHAAVRGRNS